MANLKTVKPKFTGYKTLAELTGLTFTANTTYTVQVFALNNPVYIREGASDTDAGFKLFDKTPFTWKYDGVNDLYIGSDFDDVANYELYINVAG